MRKLPRSESGDAISGFSKAHWRGHEARYRVRLPEEDRDALSTSNEDPD